MEFIAGSTELRVAEDTINDLLNMGHFESLEDLQAGFRLQIRQEVVALAEVMDAADAFDLIELMRLREVPISPVLGLDPDLEVSGAALEMIALILTCRPSRLPVNPDRVDATPPDKLIPQLHETAMRLLRLTTFFQILSARFSDKPLAALAAEYQGNIVNIRTMQYSHLQDQLNVALFGSDRLKGVLEAALGFSYAQFVEVRDAIADLYSERFIALRDETADIFEKYRPDKIPDEIAERLKEAMTQMMILPGKRAQLTVSDLAGRTECGESVIERVLDAFSLEFCQRDPADATLEFLRGNNPFRTAGLINDGEGHFIIAGNPIGTDALRYVVEDALKGGPKWNAYDKARTFVSESLAIEKLEQLLQTEVRFRGLEYFAPKDGVDPERLDARCTELTNNGNQTECDGFFVVDDLAVFLEVKGRTVADQARRGDVRRLASELSKIVGEAASQARRLEALIELNGGIWLADRTWLDLSYIREVRSIAVCLDDIGPLAIAMDDLRRVGILTDEKLPWITSLHDLSVIAEILQRPAEFVLYVRRRSDSGVAKLYRATDELDLFMLFLSNDHLYVEPDPDHVARIHPMAPKPTKAARRRFKRSQHLTRVGTHTDPLDSWMYKEEGSNPFEAEKPTFLGNPFVLDLIDELTRRRTPGWLRTTADLLATSGESQEDFVRAIKSIVRSTQLDHQPHTSMQAFAGVWGLPVVIAGTCPIGTPPDQGLASLELYMKAKKHQLKSDRSTCVLFDETGAICGAAYDNEPPGDDPELDRLVERLQLRPPGQSSRSGAKAPNGRGPKSKRRRRSGRTRR